MYNICELYKSGKQNGYWARITVNCTNTVDRAPSSANIDVVERRYHKHYF